MMQPTDASIDQVSDREPNALVDAYFQYCSLWPSAVRGCFAKTDIDAKPFGGAPFPPECIACPTCACIAGYPPWDGCECLDLDDAGAIGVSCGGCYGSPPARLERLLRG